MIDFLIVTADDKYLDISITIYYRYYCYVMHYDAMVVRIDR